MALVSFCIPTYNSERFIRECLESVLVQDYDDIEIIVSDNNSHDNTIAICQETLRKFQPKRNFKIIKNDTNIGPALNWLKAIQSANGEYVKLLFSDDLVLRDFTTKTLEFIQDEEVGFVYTAAFCGKTINASILSYLDIDIAGKVPSLFFQYKGLFEGKSWRGSGVPCSPTCGIFRKKDLVLSLENLINLARSNELPIIDALQHGAGLDSLIYLLIAFNYDYIVNIPEPLVLCREQNQSISFSETYQSLQNFSLNYLLARDFFYKNYFEPKYLSGKENLMNIQLEMNKFIPDNYYRQMANQYSHSEHYLSIQNSSSSNSLQHTDEEIISIAIDISVLGLGYLYERAKTGVFRVTEYILRGLLLASRCRLYLYASLPNLSHACQEYLNSEFIQHNLRLYDITELRYNNINIYHSTFYPLPSNIYFAQRIITVCDLIPILYPEFFEYKEDHLLKTSIGNIDKNDIVICISESTKKDVCSYKSSVNKNNVFVTYLAADKKKFYPSDNQQLIIKTKEKYNIPDKPYLLSLSTLEPRKNIAHVIRCFLKLIQSKQIDDLNLVLIGTKGWQYEEIFEEIDKNRKLQDRIVVTGYVPDEDLAPLYSGALAFLYVSLYEGFGLPPLEAMQCGTPVITSNTSSLPEVVEDAGIMLDPHDELGLCEAIFKIYSEPEYRKELAQKSLQQAQKFSWDKYVEETIKIYEVAKKKYQNRHNRNILIDGVFFQLFNTGIARVWKSLLEQWANTEFADHILVLDRANTAPKINGIRYRTIHPYDYNNTDTDRQILQQICDEEETDLFISTYYTTPIHTPSVFMAYDMIPEVLGGNLNEPMWREKHHAIKHASAFIAISENTAKDLSKFFTDIPLESITVAHCGVDPIFHPASEAEIKDFKYKYGINKSYFLLGSLGGYKNTILFFQAFAQLNNKHNFDIVATGAGSQLPSEWREYTAGCTFHALKLSDEELRLAYAGAEALVYPSQYEGFGMPIIEAMACGCPVITTPNASLPEVGGQAVIYVKDNDIECMTDALSEVQKPTVRNSLIQAGLVQSQKFSWSKMADIVSNVLINKILEPFNLREINLIIFPDWNQSEDDLYSHLGGVIKTLVNDTNYHHKITLLIYVDNIDSENADLMLSSIAMNLMIENEIDITEIIQISLIEKLTTKQWRNLLPHLHSRIVLEKEDKSVITQLQAEKLPILQIGG
ncbi:glycosyltransferase [Calothrix membranacea FACHB-236]|nr:glycosyltransferase [Calothrix membranacea FACHB-236]